MPHTGQERNDARRVPLKIILPKDGLFGGLSLSCEARSAHHGGLLMRLWRNQACVVFWSARTISFAGTGITMIVLPVLVYGMTHSPAWVASLGLIEFVPYLSFGLLAGAVADRMNRKKIMVGCDLVAAFLLITVPAVAAVHLLGMAHVLIVALGIATVYVWFDAANFGTLPVLVERSELPVAASLIGSSGQVALLCAPTIGAVLLTVMR